MLVRVKNGKIGDIPNFDSLKLASLYHIDTVKDGNAFCRLCNDQLTHFCLKQKQLHQLFTNGACEFAKTKEP